MGMGFDVSVLICPWSHSVTIARRRPSTGVVGTRLTAPQSANRSTGIQNTRGLAGERGSRPNLFIFNQFFIAAYQQNFMLFSPGYEFPMLFTIVMVLRSKQNFYLSIFKNKLLFCEIQFYKLTKQ